MPLFPKIPEEHPKYPPKFGYRIHRIFKKFGTMIHTDWLIPATGSQCPAGTMANKWVRFTFWDEGDTEVEDYTCDTPSTGCVSCMFPRNCVAGACEEG